jgi:hypothetical protein
MTVPDDLMTVAAIWAIACPVCGAQVGERCRKPNRPTRVHKRRSNLVSVRKNKKRTVTFKTTPVTKVGSGGGFETNRRRH